MFKHNESREWYTLYTKFKKNGQIKHQLNDNMLSLIKYFITSYQPMATLENLHFRKIVKINIPGKFTFREKLLPDVMTIMFNCIEKKLEASFSICLIVDIWTNNMNSDYLACAAFCSNLYHEREFFVIGMEAMPKGGHNSENIKLVIEKIVNKYKFNKSKLHGVCYLN